MLLWDFRLCSIILGYILGPGFILNAGEVFYSYQNILWMQLER